jgi:hypothetical protein
VSNVNDEFDAEAMLKKSYAEIRGRRKSKPANFQTRRLVQIIGQADKLEKMAAGLAVETKSNDADGGEGTT